MVMLALTLLVLLIARPVQRWQHHFPVSSVTFSLEGVEPSAVADGLSPGALEEGYQRHDVRLPLESPHSYVVILYRKSPSVFFIFENHISSTSCVTISFFDERPESGWFGTAVRPVVDNIEPLLLDELNALFRGNLEKAPDRACRGVSERPSRIINRVKEQ